jgi:hypothetical protein
MTMDCLSRWECESDDVILRTGTEGDSDGVCNRSLSSDDDDRQTGN